MPTRQELINELTQRKLYPKKKKEPVDFVKDRRVIPPIQQPISPQSPEQQVLEPKRKEKKGIEIPKEPLQKILFLKRTLGI